MFKKIVLFSFFACFCLNIKSDYTSISSIVIACAKEGIEFAKEKAIPVVKPIVIAGVTVSVISLGYESTKTIVATSVYWLLGGHKKDCAQKKEAIKAQIKEEENTKMHQECEMMKVLAKRNNISVSILNKHPEYAGIIQGVVGNLEKFLDLMKNSR